VAFGIIFKKSLYCTTLKNKQSDIEVDAALKEQSGNYDFYCIY